MRVPSVGCVQLREEVMPRKGARKSPKEQFWAKVSKGEGDSCWLWLGSRNDDGYGQLHYEGKGVKAHRLSWQMANGEIPGGLGVLHRCDVPACVRPSHLFLGDQGVNMRDATSKGRANRGSKNPRAKLTEDDVRAILKSPLLNKDVAAQFGVSRPVVSAIRSRKAWCHVS